MGSLILRHGKALLRDVTPADVENHVRWLTEERGWLDWDAPWEVVPSPGIERIRESFLARAKRARRSPRRTLELCAVDGSHIGRVNTYRIVGDPARRAVGITIRESSWWGRGVGADAFPLWCSYVLRAYDLDRLFCETWSGNERMIRLAARVGFGTVERRPGFRWVRGARYDALRLSVPRDAFFERYPAMDGLPNP